MNRIITIIKAEIKRLEADLATFISYNPNWKLDREDIGVVARYHAQIDTYESTLSMLIAEKSRLDKIFTDKKRSIESSLKAWNELWDGRVGDLSAPEYCAIKSEESLLVELVKEINNDSQSNPLVIRDRATRYNKDLTIYEEE